MTDIAEVDTPIWNLIQKLFDGLIHRSDDQESALSNRLKAFHKDTKPVIDYYHKQVSLIISVPFACKCVNVCQALHCCWWRRAPAASLL